jgi:hypothetical protein
MIASLVSSSTPMTIAQVAWTTVRAGSSTWYCHRRGTMKIIITT